MTWSMPFNFLVSWVALPTIEILGITTNCFNLRIFWSIGLRDAGTSSLFALAMADLVYLLIAHLTWLCNFLHFLEVKAWVKLDQLAAYMVMYLRFTVAVSILFTTYIAVQRCLCVAMPLKVKAFFTPTRNLVTLLTLCMVAASFYLPWIPQRSMKTYLDPATNVTWVGLWQGPNHEATREVADYIVSTTFPITTQTISVVCMAVLINSLRKSSKFRRAMTSSGDKDKVKARGKEVQVVKAVTFLTLMFIISNLLPIGLGLARRVVPNFRFHVKKYKEVLSLLVALRDVIQLLNSSLNIIVYYHFNSAYRSRFLALFAFCAAPASTASTRSSSAPSSAKDTSLREGAES